ncbi:MAG: hypothetical protein ABW115_22650 [Candidatus Thiodiazotropha sp. 6PLUC6]
MKPDIERLAGLVTVVATALGLVVTLFIWGMRLEHRFGELTATQQTFERVQEVRWQNLERRLETLRADIVILENRGE